MPLTPLIFTLKFISAASDFKISAKTLPPFLSSSNVISLANLSCVLRSAVCTISCGVPFNVLNLTLEPLFPKPPIANKPTVIANTPTIHAMSTTIFLLPFSLFFVLITSF